MRGGEVSRELFLPLDRARWEGDRYTLGAGASRAPAPQIVGVRFQKPNEAQVDSFPEKAFQQDLSALVRSLIELRKTPALAGAVLSPELLVGKQPGEKGCSRVIFGLHCPANGQYRNEVDAARQCHQEILAAAAHCGFILEPAHFDPQTRLAGLAAWARGVKLRPRPFTIPPWAKYLLLLPLLLLLLLPWSCGGRDEEQPLASPAKKAPMGEFFGVEVPQSFIIVLDKSGSMQPHFSRVQAEARRLLNEVLLPKQPGSFVDILVYDQTASSALGKIEQLTPDVADRLTGFLNNLQSGGGTSLRAAVDLAVQEIARHGQDTTLIILTDGIDGSLTSLIQESSAVQQQCQGARLTINTLTPRLFSLDPATPTTPQNPLEEQLDALAKAYGGKFGPS